MKQGKIRIRSFVRAAVKIIGLLCLMVLATGCLHSAPVDTPTPDDISRTLNSLQEVDDFPLYTMTYYGDYGFDDEGVAQTRGQQRLASGTAAPDHSCSTVVARNERGEVLVGRNFDWIHRAGLLLYTDSPSGYASASMVDIAYQGFENGIPADADRTPLLDTPSWPMDGMNEHGLAVSQMAVPQANLATDPEQDTYGSLEVIRLLLDHAATVSEGVDLLKGVNIDWEGGPYLHYLVADATGASAVVEFVGGEMVVTQEQVPWQIATNFTQYGTSPLHRGDLCWRYGAAEAILSPLNGQLSDEAFLEMMAGIAGDWGQAETMWTVVYNLTTGSIRVVMGREFEDVDEFALELTDAPAGR